LAVQRRHLESPSRSIEIFQRIAALRSGNAAVARPFPIHADPMCVQGEKDDEIATARGRWGFDARQPRNSGQRRSGGRWAGDDCRRNLGRRLRKLQALLAPAWPSRLPTRLPLWICAVLRRRLLWVRVRTWRRSVLRWWRSRMGWSPWPLWRSPSISQEGRLFAGPFFSQFLWGTRGEVRPYFRHRHSGSPKPLKLALLRRIGHRVRSR
jgi:hypothetical protein